MSPEAYEALEAAAFASLPALEPEEMVQGWRLRVSSGCSKRANSANSTLASVDISEVQIADIEARYRQRGLSAIFRLTSMATPQNVDNSLALRGYSVIDPSWVMVLPAFSATAVESSVRLMNIDAWSTALLRISGGSRSTLGVYLQMLRLIKGPCAFTVAHLNDDPVCAGLGVITAGKLGLFDIATAAAQRQKGWATSLCSSLLAWGKQAGAESAYLQVTASNASAIRVYEKLGFQRAYHYWYRVGAPSSVME